MISGFLSSSSWIMLAMLPALSTASHHPKPSKFGSVLPVDLPRMDDLLVTDLDKVVPVYGEFDGKMYAGSLPVDHTTSADEDGKRTGNMFFWLFVPDAPSVPDTMVSWFNGGPGCSSMFGNVFEQGPIMVPHHSAGYCCEGANEPLEKNEFAWTKATVMLYTEQPIGVGFSEATNGTPPPSSEDDVAADMEAFMQNFYQVFDFLSDHKLYLVGESYAGIYIPSIARGIYLRNDEQEKHPEVVSENRKQIPLAGIAIGNGKIDALSQDPAVIDYFYWHGLIDGPTRDVLHSEWDFCMAHTHVEDGITGTPKKTQLKHIAKNSKYYEGDSDSEEEEPTFHPYKLRDDCGIFAAAWSAAGNGAFEEQFETGPNIYEYSTWDPYEAGEGDTGTIGALFNNPDVQRALHIAEDRVGFHWQGCVPESEQADDRRRLNKILSGDAENVFSTPSSTEVEQEDQSSRRLFMDYDTPWSVLDYLSTLLDDAKIDVLMYSGDRDIICCTQGTEAALQKMDWSGTHEWPESKRSLWVYNNTYPAGYVKTHKNLQLVTVYNAGHMAPYNQPGPSLDLLERFLKQQSFHDKPLPDIVSKSTHSPPHKREDGPHPPPKSSKKKGKKNGPALLEASITGTNEEESNDVRALFSSGGGGMLLTVCAAFFMGFVAARLSPNSSAIQQVRQYSLGQRSGYGSIEGN